MLERLYEWGDTGDFTIHFSLAPYRHQLKKKAKLERIISCSSANALAFITLYNSLFANTKFIMMSWNMSSGEQSMFNIFARLHSAIDQEINHQLLLLDELDNTMHPTWQQMILNRLTTFLHIMYPEKKFQILMTTHSPMLLSDIPKDNILFMKKRDGVVEKHKETFAANIADLYYDSFFMEEGSIGEISKRTIINMFRAIQEYEKNPLRCDDPLKRFVELQYPNGPSEIILTKQQLMALIDSIGEDIWRNKLKEHYEQYFHKDDDDEVQHILETLNHLIETAKDSDERSEILEKIKTLLKE